MLSRWFVAGLALLSASGPAAAVGYVPGVQVDNIRCSGDVVSVGDLSYQLVEKCGEPDFQETVELRREAVEVTEPGAGQTFELEIGAIQAVERWVYQRRGRLTRVLTLQGGVLIDIRLTER